MSGRTLAILMWKHLKVRMKRFIHTPVEFLSPIIFFVLLFIFRNKFNAADLIKQSYEVRNTDEIPWERLEVPRRVYFTPDTNFTNSLMREAGSVLGLQPLSAAKYGKTRPSFYYPFSNWSELSEVLDQFGDDDAIIEIHEHRPDENKLSYTIRLTSKYSTNTLRSEDATYTEIHPSYGSDFHKFVSLQWALDTSFIKLRSGQNVTQKLSLQEFPSVLRSINMNVLYVGKILPSVSWISLLLQFVFVMARLVDERSTGIQELLKLNGVSSNMLGISNFLNVLPAGLVFAVVGATLLVVSSSPLLPGVSWPLLVLFLLLYFTSVVSMAFAASYIMHNTRYSTSLAVLVYILMWTPAHYFRSSTGAAHQLAGIFPHMPSAWLWREISMVAVLGAEFDFSDIWQAHSENTGPVALAILFLILQSLLFFALTWYLARVRPGPHGHALRWNFLCQKQYWSRNVPPEWVPDEVPISRQEEYFEATPTNAEVGIKVENVTKIFSKHKVLSNVSFDALKGEITVLLGHNGAGKTTLMSIITGMISATEGRVLVNGVDTTDARSGVTARRQLGLCTQENLFMANITVLEHVMFFTLLKTGSLKEARVSSVKLLKRLRLEDKAAVSPHALSGGMKRRLQLACALAGGASVLVLDEPTSGLDVETRRELWDLLLSFRDNHTVLLTTHFMEEADNLGDRVAAMYQGHLRCHATPMHLKRAIGTGYRLMFTTKGTPQETLITSTVTRYVPDASLREQNINSLSYNLPAASSGRFPELFSVLEANKSSLQVETIGVGLTTLEEVFIKLCSDADPYNEEIDGSAEVAGFLIHLTVSMAIVFNRWYSNCRAPHNLYFVRETNWTQPVPTAGLPAYETPVLVFLAHKAILHIPGRATAPIGADGAQCLDVGGDQRQPKLQQILLPILAICAIVHITNNDNESKESSNKRLNFDLDLYELPTRRVLTNVEQVDKNTLRDFWSAVEFVNTDNITEAMLRVSRDKPSRYGDYLAGVELDERHAKAFYSTTVKFAAPVAVNLVSNALAARYMRNDTGRTINVNYFPVIPPMPLQGGTNEIVEAKFMLETMMFVILIIFVMLATHVNNVSLPCKERVSGARHNHFMSGCPAILYWAVTLCFHMLLGAGVLVVALVVIVSLFEADQTLNKADVLAMMALVMLLGSLAFFAFMYLVSFFFDQVVASIVLIVIAVFFGIITAPHVTFVQIGNRDDQNETDLWTVLMSYFNYFAPPHTISTAALKVTHIARLNTICDLNQDKCPGLTVNDTGFNTQKCCSGEKTMTYLSMDDLAPGKELILLVVQFVVLMCLVILIQYGVLNKLCDRIMNSEYRKQNQNRGEIDEAVRTEEVFVEKQIALPKTEIMESGQAMLVHNLHKRYTRCCNKPVTAVKGTSLSVKKGECFGLLGVNGAGKSTTFKMITAEECATKGSIYANGHFIDERAPYLQSLGYCPQFCGLDEFLTGSENLRLVLTLRGLRPADVRRETDTWIQIVGLESYRNKKVADYSGGCKRRIAAAAALCSGAPVTLLDEPTSGVDVAARRRVWSALLRSLRQGRAVVITSHSMDEMEALCNRIAIMSLGTVRVLGTPSELRAHFGSGRTITIKMAPQTNQVAGATSASERDQLKEALQQKFNGTLKDDHETMWQYHIGKTVPYSELFNFMEQLKQKHPRLVEDYSITESTLEEVFLSIAREQQQLQETERQQNLAGKQTEGEGPSKDVGQMKK